MLKLGRGISLEKPVNRILEVDSVYGKSVSGSGLVVSTPIVKGEFMVEEEKIRRARGLVGFGDAL